MQKNTTPKLHLYCEKVVFLLKNLHYSKKVITFAPDNSQNNNILNQIAYRKHLLKELNLRK